MASMSHSLLPLTLVAAALVLTSLPGHAQYKIVEPDGRVTYTDRPPALSAGARVTAVRRDGTVAAAADEAAALPLELRQVRARFPVTLYVGVDCPPCDSGRRLLRARGVPYIERVVSDDRDGEELLRLSNGRTVPTLTVGAQVLQGYSETEWQSTLDLAAYPRESRLPRNYLPPIPTPLTARAPEPAAVAQAPEPRAEPRAEPLPAAPPPAASGPSIRF